MALRVQARHPSTCASQSRELSRYRGICVGLLVKTFIRIIPHFRRGHGSAGQGRAAPNDEKWPHIPQPVDSSSCSAFSSHIHVESASLSGGPRHCAKRVALTSCSCSFYLFIPSYLLFLHEKNTPGIPSKERHQLLNLELKI